MTKNIELVQQDTIFALATGNNLAAIAIIRISGLQAKKIGQSVARIKFKQTSKLYLANFYSKNTKIDQIMISYFKGPRSYTGQDMVEIHCHGSKVIIHEIFKTLEQDFKIRAAQPGEFTKRAYLNDKISLLMAESIADLIDAKYLNQAKLALRVLDGATNSFLNKLNNKLIEILANLEARIDFVEDVDELDISKIKKQITKLHSELDEKTQGFEAITVNDGINIGLFGRVNVGKSSLYNKLLLDDKAIVSSIAGTTRDLLSDQISIGSYLVRLFDTAGFRLDLQDPSKDSGGKLRLDQDVIIDEIEAIGLKKASDLAKKVDIKLWLTDHTSFVEDLENIDLQSQKTEFDFFVINKIDLIDKKQQQEIFKACRKKFDASQIIFISALEYTNINLIKIAIEKLLDDKFSQTFKDLPITRQRHKEELSLIIVSLKAAQNSFDLGLDLVAEEIQHAVFAINRLIGSKNNLAHLDKIFSTFCIGK